MSGKELNIQNIAKNELIAKKISKDCQKAFLSAVARGSGQIALSSRGFGLTFEHENKDLIKLCVSIIDSAYGFEGIVENSNKNIGMRALNLYRVTYEQGADKLLNELRIMDGYETVKGIPKEFTQKTARAKAYLKGIFLSCGALSVPNDKDAQAYEGRKGYHLEFNLGTDLIVKDLITLICKLSGIEPRSVKQRKNSPSVYIKSAQSISDCLAAMGAAKAVLMLQQVMVNRAMRNHLNRGNNFILANIDKSVNASRKQTEAIQKIFDAKRQDLLSDSLLNTARARLNYPDAALSEIAEMTGSTKSKINHHMRKIIEIAKNL
ncbi:MAG: DNA-binding protein WhiA [Christensenellales bacterium]|nr:DNA-binding protein WhiA [Clostridiales bacterium]